MVYIDILDFSVRVLVTTRTIALAGFCRETPRISIVDFGVDLDGDMDLDGVTASAGTNRACQMSHRQELVSLETGYVHVDVQVEVQVHVLELEAGFAPKSAFCDRN